MQKQVERGQAPTKGPKGVDRVDKGRGPNEKDHVHLKDGRALNSDGTWKHGSGSTSSIPRKVRNWLKRNGWDLP